MEHAGDYGSVSNSRGGVAPRKHKLNRSNIEQAENDQMMERRLRGEKVLYPWVLHKVGGLTKTVTHDDEYRAALANGWYDDIRKVPTLAPTAPPTQISHMTITQALAFVVDHADDPVKLAEIEADELAHGHRAAVVQALDAAKDAVGSPKANKARK